MARTEIDGPARARHTRRFWTENDRGDYECPGCGRGVEEVYRFEVHHIDGDPQNGDDENLIALCRKCHYEEHGREPPETLDEWKTRVEEL